MRQEADNKEFFKILHQNYPLIRKMCINAERFSSRDETIEFINEFYAEKDKGVQAAKLFEDMRNCGMLGKNHSLWSVPSYITLFIRKREGRLHYTSQRLIRACLHEIDTRSEGLEKLLQYKTITSGEIEEELFAIEDTYQQLSAAAQNNCRKISQEVSTFKLEDSLEISSYKINRFIRLHDDFIAPMLAIVVDSDNEFENVSLKVYNICNSLTSTFGRTNHLGYHIRGLVETVKIIQEQVAGKLLQAKNELDIIFEVYHEHRRIIEGINYFWKICLEEREDEKERIFNKYFLGSGKLRVFNPNNFSYQNQLQKQLYPEHLKRPARPLHSLGVSRDDTGTIHGLICFTDICKNLLRSKHHSCLLTWLAENYAGEDATFYVEKLFELEKCFPEKIKVSAEEKYFQLDSIQVKLQSREWNNNGK
ncbi:MAG: hypothetical protein WCS27_10210 [Victivallaceae bacterium]